jgi:hypothetical protein
MGLKLTGVLIAHYHNCSAGESALLRGSKSTAQHGLQGDNPNPRSRHKFKPSLRFCSPVCDMPIFRHPRCLDEAWPGRRPPVESLQNPDAGTGPHRPTPSRNSWLRGANLSWSHSARFPLTDDHVAWMMATRKGTSSLSELHHGLRARAE